MTDLLSKVRWGRVLVAALATHVANVVVAVLLIVVYTLLAVGPQREPGGGITDSLASQVATWPVPILTLFAAAWVARKVRPETASLHGLLVGLLVAVIFAILYFGPSGMWGLLLFTLMIVAGLLGASSGSLTGSPRYRPRQRDESRHIEDVLGRVNRGDRPRAATALDREG